MTEIPKFTSKTEEFSTLVDKINELRKNIASSQKILDRYRKEYKDVIECENMDHEIVMNSKLIDKLTTERDQLKEQVAMKQQQQAQQQQYQTAQQQQYQLAQPQQYQTAQQQYQQVQQQPAQQQQPNQFSQEAFMVEQTLKMNPFGIQLQLVYEGPLSIVNFVQTNQITDYMIMWKTVEGFYCGGIVKFGWYLCYVGGNIYFFRKIDPQNPNQPVPLRASYANAGDQKGLSFDDCIYIFDNFLYYTRGIDQEYKSANCAMISRLLSGQAQQDHMKISVEKFLVFRV